MKKSLVPLFFLLLLGCSSDDFKSEIAASAQKDVDCWVIHEDDNRCHLKRISQNLCVEIGGIPKEECPEDVISSSSEDVSSSSSAGNLVGSSSSSLVGSSSSDLVISSSSNLVGSSSSSLVGSSSSNLVGSSSSSDVSSSSVVAGSSSSVVAGSSSSISSSGSSSSRVSSSSVGSSSSVASSSSAVSSSSSASQPAPTWTGCNIPSYVGRNEPIANLKFISIENNNGRCGAITYKLNGTGSNVTTLNYASNQIGTNQTLNITASTTCSGGITLNSKPCSESVTVADYVKFSDTDDTYLKAGKTIVDVGVSATLFGCQARDNTESPNPFEGKTSFILDGKTVSVTDNTWWVKTEITGNRMLFESNNENVGSYRCQIE